MLTLNGVMVVPSRRSKYSFALALSTVSLSSSKRPNSLIVASVMPKFHHAAQLRLVQPENSGKCADLIILCRALIVGHVIAEV